MKQFSEIKKKNFYEINDIKEENFEQSLKV